MTVSWWWPLVTIVTFIVGFGVLVTLAVFIDDVHPPIPGRVVDPEGEVLFTADDVMRGQHLFQQRGLMQYGTVFGHGAYLGPDFTAQYLHEATGVLAGRALARGASPAAVLSLQIEELKGNRHDPRTGALTFTAGQAEAFRRMQRFYADYFAAPDRQTGLQRPHISGARDLHDLTAFFAWAAWAATTSRPGTHVSYTNNWPPEPAAGNVLTAEAFLWSALSLIALLGGVGIVFYLFGRYDFLGWHRRSGDEGRLRFRDPDAVRLTPAQRAVPWYFLVISGLFLAQGLLGGANAHYHVEPSSFYGFDIARVFPYNLTRTWHLQLALFFVTASYLGMGIFVTPMIAGREPRHQRMLALVLFGALVLLVVGSLTGELLAINGWAADGWFWILLQGWEYLDLARAWQLTLTAGLVIWVLIMVRGLWPRLREDHPANLPWLFLYSVVSIPLFYAAGLMFWKTVQFTVMDFWRFWVVHLWVEDFLELFTTITVAFLFVLLRVVRLEVATRVVYLDAILYSVGGVIGTMHHLYFSGAPSVYLALGAFFSAMEVIPLVLLSYEAWRFMQLGGARHGASASSASSREFPHKWAVMFLIAVGFWNFLGAGVFGFLINLPVVSYYEIGTAWTANHAHGALMGVYGMLAIGFFMFVARYFVPGDRRTDLAMRVSFWSLNIGLAWMLFANLLPLGILQMLDSARYGYWHAREPAFFRSTAVRVIEWLRLPGDVLFIVGGILPIVYLAVRMFLYRRRPGELPLGSGAEPFTEER